MAAVQPRTKTDLFELAKALPDDAYFLEHSRSRELEYIERSYARWAETIELVQNRFPNFKGSTCLDIGTSPFTFLLNGHFQKVSGLDLSSAFSARCAAAGIQLYVGGVMRDETLAQIEKVDCIFFLEVLEHLHENPVNVLARLRSLLRPGGLLVFSTPNLACLANRVLMLLNRKLRYLDHPPYKTPDSAHGFGHDRIFMPIELWEYARASGFSEVEVAYQRHVLSHAGLSLPRRLRALVPGIIKYLVPSTRDGTIVFARD